jgi:hypothetical protein
MVLKDYLSASGSWRIFPQSWRRSDGHGGASGRRSVGHGGTSGRRSGGHDIEFTNMHVHFSMNTRVYHISMSIYEELSRQILRLAKVSRSIA